MGKDKKIKAKQNFQEPVGEKDIPVDPNDPHKRYKDFKWENPDQLKNGPISDESRKCRDCICCIIFLILFAACIAVGVLGFVNGKPTAFLYTYDEDGNACGHDKGYEDYPFLYFYNVISGVSSFSTDGVIQGVCVSECPIDKRKDVTTYYELKCKKTTKNGDCKVDKKNYYESKPILGRLCFPTSKDPELDYDPNTQVKVTIYDPNTGDSFEKVLDNNADNIQTVGTKMPVFSLFSNVFIKCLFFENEHLG